MNLPFLTSPPLEALARPREAVGSGRVDFHPFEGLWIRFGTPPGALGEGPRNEESRAGRRPREAEGLGQGSSVPSPSSTGVAERVQGGLFTASHGPWASYLTFLGHSFLLCKMRVILVYTTQNS